MAKSTKVVRDVPVRKPKPAHEYTEAELDVAQVEKEAVEEVLDAEAVVDDLVEDTADEPCEDDHVHVDDRPCLTCGKPVQFHYARNKFPLDRYSLTSNLKKELQKVVRKAGLHPVKMRVLDDTINDLLMWRNEYRREMSGRKDTSLKRQNLNHVSDPVEMF